MWPHKASSHLKEPASPDASHLGQLTISPATWQFNSSSLSPWPCYIQMVFRTEGQKMLSGVCFKFAFNLLCVSYFALVSVLQQKQNRGKRTTMSQKFMYL